MSKNTEKSISIRFPFDVQEAVKALAQQHERSFNGEVIWALRQYIAQQQQEQQKEERKDT